MATIHANTQLKTGDIVNGLSGLKDCESGRCLNLRLDGKAVAPEGWPSVCQPPHVRYFYVNLNLHEHNPSVPPYKSLRVDVATKQEAVNLLKQFYAGYSDSNFGCAEEPITKSFAEALERYSVCYTQRQLCTPDRKSKVWCSGGVFARFCPRENAPDVCKGKTTWPKETCSELIYYAASGRFKPACAQHDPHLPDSLKNERRCLSLCDAEGNCVIIRKTERGIELWQEKYKQCALIDPATGKVLGVEQDNGTAKLELTSLTAATLPADRQRTTIGVGETVTVLANQLVEWEIKGSLLGKEQKTATTLTFMASDQAGAVQVIAKTECEVKSILFSVLQPSGLRFIKTKEIHVHNVLDAGFLAQLYIQPAHVNFSKVVIREVDSPSYGGTGLFSMENGRMHGDYIKKHEYTSGWMKAISYSEIYGTLMEGEDVAYQVREEYCPDRIPKSEIHYSIPYEWRINGVDAIHQLPLVYQSCLIESTGRIIVKKGTEAVSFHYSDKGINEDILLYYLPRIPVFKIKGC